MTVSEDDVERVDEDYVDPRSVTRGDILADLESAGITGDSREAFADRMLTSEYVAEQVRDSAGSDRILTRETVEDTTDRVARDVPHNEGREPAIADSVSEELGAVSEGELTRARGELARSVGDDGVVRTDPSLDPLAEGGEGREIGTVSEVTKNTGGRGGGLREGVEPIGGGRGMYYYEGSDGTRYPVAEVRL